MVAGLTWEAELEGVLPLHRLRCAGGDKQDRSSMAVQHSQQGLCSSLCRDCYCWHTSMSPRWLSTYRVVVHNQQLQQAGCKTRQANQTGSHIVKLFIKVSNTPASPAWLDPWNHAKHTWPAPA